MGGFYGLINYGGDFIQWLNVAFIGLAPHEFGILVDTLQSAGAIICLIIWGMGVAALIAMRHFSVSFFARANMGTAPRDQTVGGPVINGQAREL